MVIADHLEEIMTQEGSLADDDLRVLFKRIHGIDFQRAEREGFEERRSAIEDLFADAGIDIDLGDLEPGMSEAAIAAKIAEMAGRIEEKIKNEEDKMHRPGQGRTRQLAKEERMRQAEEVRSKSIASIYKQLAKALIPISSRMTSAGGARSLPALAIAAAIILRRSGGMILPMSICRPSAMS